MARVPLPPDLLKGQAFFVLRWDDERDKMFVHIDDEDKSSFDLGGYLPQVVRQLTWWGIEELYADRVVNQAREFHAVQAIPSQNRILNLFDRTNPQRRLDPFTLAQQLEPKMVMLP